MPQSLKLTEKSLRILRLIARGHSYAQIVDSHPELTYLDIFAAADEALHLNEASAARESGVRQPKSKYPRAYERWERVEDVELETLFREGQTVSQLADHLGRQPSAIRSRLSKLGYESGSHHREK